MCVVARHNASLPRLESISVGLLESITQGVNDEI